MKRLLLIAAAWLVVAIVWPELRPVLVVGSFCWVTGFIVGSQRKAKDDAELVTARLVRSLEA